MGDAILSTPALRRLRQSLPDRRLTFLGSNSVSDVLAGVPWADDWITSDRPTPALLRHQGFDAVILMKNSYRSALLARRARIKRLIGYRRDGRGPLLSDSVLPVRLAGHYAPISMLSYYSYLADEAIKCLHGQSNDATDNHMELFTNDQDRARVDELYADWSISPDEPVTVMVPGGAFGPSKWWPPERFAALAQRLHQEQVARVMISCAPTQPEQQLASAVCLKAPGMLRRLPHDFGLGPLKELVRRSALMISNDTGPCHIAAAFGTPLVTMFGPTDPRWTATGYQNEIRLRVNTDCGPCQRGVCQGNHRCMERISVDDVYQAAAKLLDRHAPGPQKQTRPGTYYSAFTEDFVPLHDASGLIHADYKHLLEPNNLATLSQALAFQDGHSLTKPALGSRERIRITLKGNGAPATVVYLKRYGPSGFFQSLRACLSPSPTEAPAVNDFHAAMLLAECSISVPRPLAYGRAQRRLGYGRSFSLSEELPHADALERLLPRWTEVQSRYQMLRDKKALIASLASLVRRLHANHYYHRDLYLSHIFLCRDRHGLERLSLIDLQRVFQPTINKGRWQVKDLSQLYYSARSYFTQTDALRFLRAYLDRKRLSPDDKRLIRRVRRKAARIARHAARRQARLRSNT